MAMASAVLGRRLYKSETGAGALEKEIAARGWKLTEYDGWQESSFVAGDLSGNGAEDDNLGAP